MSIASMSVRQEIGRFLRQQRHQRDPEAYPRLVARRRHVAYLTQADVAELAGVSDAVVAKIESGRYENLNPVIVAKLAAALRLTPNQEHYLLNFFHPQNGDIDSKRDSIPEMLRTLVESTMPNPAMIVSTNFDLVYWNRNAVHMLGDFDSMPRNRRNIAVQMFLEPVMRQRWINWESNARNIVSGLRMAMSQGEQYRDQIARLAEFLSNRDPLFRAWWASEEPILMPNHEKDFQHPIYGMLRVYQTVGAILGCPDYAHLLLTPRDAATSSAFRLMASEQPLQDPVRETHEIPVMDGDALD